MDDYEKSQYSYLINRLYSIASSISRETTNVSNIKNTINQGIKVNNKTYEADQINSVVSSLNTSKNRIYSLCRTMTNKINN